MDLLCCFLISCVTCQRVYCAERREAVKRGMVFDTRWSITDMRSISVEWRPIAFEKREHHAKTGSADSEYVTETGRNTEVFCVRISTGAIMCYVPEKISTRATHKTNII